MNLEQAVKSGYPFKHSSWKEYKDPGTSACGFDVTILEAISDDWEVKYPPVTLTMVVRNGAPVSLSPQSTYTVFGSDKYVAQYNGLKTFKEWQDRNPGYTVRRFVEVIEDKE